MAVLVSELVPSKATLRLVTMVARPIATFGHDWVLDNGAQEFRTAVLG